MTTKISLTSTNLKKHNKFILTSIIKLLKPVINNNTNNINKNLNKNIDELEIFAEQSHSGKSITLNIKSTVNNLDLILKVANFHEFGNFDLNSNEILFCNNTLKSKNSNSNLDKFINILNSNTPSKKIDDIKYILYLNNNDDNIINLRLYKLILNESKSITSKVRIEKVGVLVDFQVLEELE